MRCSLWDYYHPASRPLSPIPASAYGHASEPDSGCTLQAAPEHLELDLAAVNNQGSREDARVWAWLAACLQQQLLGSRLHLLTQRDPQFLHAWFEP